MSMNTLGDFMAQSTANNMAPTTAKTTNMMVAKGKTIKNMQGICMSTRA